MVWRRSGDGVGVVWSRSVLLLPGDDDDDDGGDDGRTPHTLLLLLPVPGSLLGAAPAGSLSVPGSPG